MPSTFAQRFWRVARSIVRWTAIVVAVLVILFVVADIEEDWRGARDWAACKKELLGRGEILDLSKISAPGQPEDNLSKVPIFAEIYHQPPPRFQGTIMTWSPPPTRLDRINTGLGSDKYPDLSETDRFERKPLDLAAWQHFYHSIPEAHLPATSGTPADDVLYALKQLDPELARIEEAFANPNAYWPSNFDLNVDWPGVRIANAKIELAKIDELRAIAHLTDHQSDLAEKDYGTLLQLTRPDEKGCILVDYLVDAGVRSIGHGILWEGIHRHAWSEVQLQEMESMLSRTDMLKEAVRMFRFERAYTLTEIEFFQNHGSDASSSAYYKNSWLFLHLRPAGWWDQDRKAYCSEIQRQIDSIHVEAGTLLKLNQDSTGHALSTRIHTPFAALAYRNSKGLGGRIAETETNRRLALLACRLEEFYLINKHYPDSLNELGALPPHRNEEVLTGAPMHYRREGDSYMLYSVGWDGVDHGGVRRGPAYEKNGVSNVRDEWDWIWPGP